MTKLEKEVVGFSFQEIPLEEALNVVLAGDGNYSEIKQTLLEKLPQLDPGKAFAFGLPNGKEVVEENRRGLCMAINVMLKRAKMDWRVTYSGIKKMFICIPRTIREKSGEHLMKNHTIFSSEDQKVIAFRAKGLSPKQIAEHVSVPIERIKYLVYKMAPGKRKEHLSASITKDLPKSMSPTHLIDTAQLVFDYKGDFKNGDSKAFRKAISVVGVNKLGFSPKELAPLIGLSWQGIYFNAHSSKSNFASAEIKALQKAVNQEA